MLAVRAHSSAALNEFGAKDSIVQFFRLLQAAFLVLLAHGPGEVLKRTKQTVLGWMMGTCYPLWIKRYERPPFIDLTPPASGPRFSIAMPVYNSDERWLRAAIESVLQQSYKNWELCIADDASTNPNVRVILHDYLHRDSRIKVVLRETNGQVSEASNSALTLASGNYLALLDHDDVIPAHALATIAAEIERHPEADLIYTDEDKIDESGRRYAPYFKPDWNKDLFYSQNLIRRFGIYRLSVVRELGGFRIGYEGNQDYDLALRFIEKIPESHIRHIPRVLYHSRAMRGSAALDLIEKACAPLAARRALQGHFDRLGISARVVEGFRRYHRAMYSLPNPCPLVSVIVCTKDKLVLFRQVIEGLLTLTDYRPLEVIVVDHESKEPEMLDYLGTLEKRVPNSEFQLRRIQFSGPFNFSAMNNRAVREAKGSLLCFLNNDVRMIHPEWLSEMVSHAVRPDIGAVGAQLLYEDGRIQHAGVIIGIGGIAGHYHRFLPNAEGGYSGRAQLIQNFSAVTAACMVMRNSVFNEVNGFDEEHLAVDFNDVDLCLKIRDRGYRNLYTPYARLFHLESASRGSSLDRKHRSRFGREIEFMKQKWGDCLLTDPSYNPNLSLNTEAGFRLAVPPRFIGAEKYSS